MQGYFMVHTQCERFQPNIINHNASRLFIAFVVYDGGRELLNYKQLELKLCQRNFVKHFFYE